GPRRSDAHDGAAARRDELAVDALEAMPEVEARPPDACEPGLQHEAVAVAQLGLDLRRLGAHDPGHGVVTALRAPVEEPPARPLEIAEEVGSVGNAAWAQLGPAHVDVEAEDGRAHRVRV